MYTVYMYTVYMYTSVYTVYMYTVYMYTVYMYTSIYLYTVYKDSYNWSQISRVGLWWGHADILIYSWIEGGSAYDRIGLWTSIYGKIFKNLDMSSIAKKCLTKMRTALCAKYFKTGQLYESNRWENKFGESKSSLWVQYHTEYEKFKVKIICISLPNISTKVSLTNMILSIFTPCTRLDYRTVTEISCASFFP